MHCYELCIAKRSNLLKRCAFTLAEVLITLGIIGVVAAITLPIVVKKYNEHVLVNLLKRDYSLFYQVTKQADWEFQADWENTRVVDLYNYFISNIKTVRACPKTSGCFESAPLNYLKSSSAGNWNNWSRYKFVMQTGEFVMISPGDRIIENCFGDNKPKLYLFVDINGLKKPNRIGRDVFVFGIRNGELVPSGKDTDSINCNLKKSQSGYDCAAKVLKEGKFTY